MMRTAILTNLLFGSLCGGALASELSGIAHVSDGDTITSRARRSDLKVSTRRKRTKSVWTATAPNGPAASSLATGYPAELVTVKSPVGFLASTVAARR
jgi:hypothetical protein